MKTFLEDAEKLYDITKTGFEDVPEYELFTRCFSEQSIIENGQRRWITKQDRLGHSQLLLNPTDPEATFRKKAGKKYQGYVANIEESVGENGTVITDYQYEQNIHSDSQFIKDRLNELPPQKEGSKMIVDGAYYSQEASTLAEKKNVELLPTALAIKNTRSNKDGFELNPEKTRIIKCPAGYAPQSCSYKKSNDEFKLSFDRNHWVGCPYQDICHPKIFKKVAQLYITKTNLLRIELERKMTTPIYDLYRRIRNGVETIPSILRRNYNLEKLPRGKQRGKFFFGSKIAALNFRKLFRYRKESSNYAQNPLFA